MGASKARVAESCAPMPYRSCEVERARERDCAACGQLIRSNFVWCGRGKEKLPLLLVAALAVSSAFVLELVRGRGHAHRRAGRAAQHRSDRVHLRATPSAQTL